MNDDQKPSHFPVPGGHLPWQRLPMDEQKLSELTTRFFTSTESKEKIEILRTLRLADLPKAQAARAMALGLRDPSDEVVDEALQGMRDLGLSTSLVDHITFLLKPANDPAFKVGLDYLESSLADMDAVEHTVTLALVRHLMAEARLGCGLIGQMFRRQDVSLKHDHESVDDYLSEGLRVIPLLKEKDVYGVIHAWGHSVRASSDAMAFFEREGRRYQPGKARRHLVSMAMATGQRSAGLAEMVVEEWAHCESHQLHTLMPLMPALGFRGAGVLMDQAPEFRAKHRVVLALNKIVSEAQLEEEERGVIADWLVKSMPTADAECRVAIMEFSAFIHKSLPASSAHDYACMLVQSRDRVHSHHIKQCVDDTLLAFGEQCVQAMVEHLPQVISELDQAALVLVMAKLVARVNDPERYSAIQAMLEDLETQNTVELAALKGALLCSAMATVDEVQRTFHEGLNALDTVSEWEKTFILFSELVQAPAVEQAQIEHLRFSVLHVLMVALPRHESAQHHENTQQTVDHAFQSDVVVKWGIQCLQNSLRFGFGSPSTRQRFVKNLMIALDRLITFQWVWGPEAMAQVLSMLTETLDQEDDETMTAAFLNRLQSDRERLIYMKSACRLIERGFVVETVFFNDLDLFATKIFKAYRLAEMDQRLQAWDFYAVLSNHWQDQQACLRLKNLASRSLEHAGLGDLRYASERLPKLGHHQDLRDLIDKKLSALQRADEFLRFS